MATVDSMQYVIYANKLTEGYVSFHKRDGESMARAAARLLREQAEEFYKEQAYAEEP